MPLSNRTRRFEGPLMAVVLAASLAGLTYVIKDYYDTQERNLLYSRIANARMDERTRATKDADKRLEDMRDYYARLSLERDSRLQQLSDQNKELLELNKQAVSLIQAGQADRKKALAVATVAAKNATQATNVATATSKALTTVVTKEQIPASTVKKLNETIKGVNRK